MRLRIRFTKSGKVRFTSHRDVARAWERALRRAGLPVMMTAGFSPRPRVSFGLALPTGHESVAEYLDVELAYPAGHPLDVDSTVSSLSGALPAGIDAVAAAVVEDRDGSLQQEVTCCCWCIEVPGMALAEAGTAVARTLAAPSLVATRVRKGVEVVDDLRPAIVALSVDRSTADGEGVVLLAELATQPRGLRPGELLDVVFPDRAPGVVDEARVLRTHQWIERDGARWEPLPLMATSAPYAPARAS